MKKIANILGVISLVGLIFTGVGVIVFYVIEFISSFLVTTINMVEIGDIFWKGIYICFSISVCTFILSYLMGKNK